MQVVLRNTGNRVAPLQVGTPAGGRPARGTRPQDRRRSGRGAPVAVRTPKGRRRWGPGRGEALEPEKESDTKKISQKWMLELKEHENDSNNKIMLEKNRKLKIEKFKTTIKIEEI